MNAPAASTDELAAMAHRLWCEHMTDTGWRFGPAYDPEARTHDALVPFGRLAPHDVRSTRAGVTASSYRRHWL